MNKDTFGINMEEWCREHEGSVREAIRGCCVTEEILDEHREKTAILQHERLIHLIVTVMTVIVELFVVGVVLFLPEKAMPAAIIMLGFAVLLGFYFRHYFFLENTVQRWYKLTDEMRRALQEAEKADQMYGELDDSRR